MSARGRHRRRRARPRARPSSRASAASALLPRAPRQVLHFSSVDDMLETSQREFWALDLFAGGTPDEAHARGAGSTSTRPRPTGRSRPWLDLLGRERRHLRRRSPARASRVVTFAQVLKHDAFPLAAHPRGAPEDRQRRVATPGRDRVRREPAPSPRAPRGVRVPPDAPARASARARGAGRLGEVDRRALLCRSRRRRSATGGSRASRTSSSSTSSASSARRAPRPPRRWRGSTASSFAEGTPYLLVGVGRWGSRDPWLGIPVTWEQISGARVIVEAGLRDLKVEPSQGSHFFQNLVSFDVGYFTVDPDVGDGLRGLGVALGAARRLGGTRRASRRVREPLLVKVNGNRHEGVIFKP